MAGQGAVVRGQPLRGLQWGSNTNHVSVAFHFSRCSKHPITSSRNKLYATRNLSQRAINVYGLPIDG
jgi:hypothetical protein